MGDQRDAGCLEGGGVPVNGAQRDLVLVGQLLCRHLAPGLEEKQDRQQPAHPHIADGTCQCSGVGVWGVSFREKFVPSLGLIEAADRQIKRYHVTSAGDEVEGEVVGAAYAFLPTLLATPGEETAPAGFAVLHRNVQGTFLNAHSWVWGNVIECRTAAAGIAFLGCDDQDPANFKPLDRPWIGCVWELAPFGHERSAWARHVLKPESPDLAGYLSDTFPDGISGGAG